MRSWAALEASVGGHGPLSGPLWAVWDRSRGLCGRSWAARGASVGDLGPPPRQKCDQDKGSVLKSGLNPSGSRIPEERLQPRGPPKPPKPPQAMAGHNIVGNKGLLKGFIRLIREFDINCLNLYRVHFSQKTWSRLKNYVLGPENSDSTSNTTHMFFFSGLESPT